MPRLFQEQSCANPAVHVPRGAGFQTSLPENPPPPMQFTVAIPQVPGAVMSILASLITVTLPPAGIASHVRVSPSLNVPKIAPGTVRPSIDVAPTWLQPP